MKIYDTFEEWMMNGAPVGELGDETEYPIAGCRRVIDQVLYDVLELAPESVLCVGPGSEKIADVLSKQNCDVWVADSNIDKLQCIAARLRNANFLHCDIFDIMPEVVYSHQFDAIVCTYIMHTTGGDDRLWTIEDFIAMLNDNGRLIIGDVCFWTTAEREICRRRCRDSWDSESHYIVYDEFRKLFDDGCVRFNRLSHCAGVITLGDFDCADDDDDE